MTAGSLRESRRATCGRWLLVILGAVLPFEIRFPVVQIGPLSVTNVEVVLYATLACWAASMAGRALRALSASPSSPVGSLVVGIAGRWSLVHWASLAWMVVVVAAAVGAPVHRDHAMKFALRSLSGGLLAFAVVDLADDAAAVRRMLVSVCLGAFASALAAYVEVGVDAADSWLTVFKTQPSVAGGFRRASGSFQYANTAAMYWEASVPVMVALAVWYARRGRLGYVLGLVAAAATGTALVLSVSRAALGSLGAVLAIMSVATWRRERAIGLLTISLVAIIAVASVVAPTPLLSLRFRTDDQSAWNRAEWLATPETLAVPSESRTQTRVTVRNDGLLPWSHDGREPVFLSYHVLDANGAQVLAYDGPRTVLPQRVVPGREVTVDAEVFVTLPPGRYVLEWDMVREGVTWFGPLGAPIARTALDVVPNPRSTREIPPPEPTHITPTRRPDRRDLWRAAVRMWREAPWLGKGPDVFRLIYGPYLGWSPFDERVTANSLYLETLATQGAIGTLALLSLLGSLGWSVVVWWRRPPTPLFLTVMGVTGALATYVVHGAVDYFLSFTPTLGLFWLLVGALGALASPRPAGPSMPTTPR
ncbi:MAG: O-antigen ligase family protein [Vicinamibacterales bacterium]